MRSNVRRNRCACLISHMKRRRHPLSLKPFYARRACPEELLQKTPRIISNAPARCRVWQMLESVYLLPLPCSTFSGSTEKSSSRMARFFTNYSRRSSQQR
ncbi:hypothetical protein KCP74_16105 [Salmonella enterica subsp. enterica]|nr:hypothetical protein KCP74_16105 [Salmonella enterica subsp. enterica]